MKRQFCGSVAESVISDTNVMYVRFYAEKAGINSNFISVFTAMHVLGQMEQCDPEVSNSVIKETTLEKLYLVAKFMNLSVDR